MDIRGSAKRRDYRVDLLRGLSIGLVLLHHFDISYSLVRSSLAKLVPSDAIHAVVRNGNYGVILFFVVSGYLITSTSLRRFGSFSGVSARAFYLFRFARIYPCLLLVLGLVTLGAWAGIRIFQDDRGVPLWLAELSVLTFWHNVLMARSGWFNYSLNILWSLSVEEVFYFTFPLVCLLRRTRWILPVWALAIVTGPIYRHLHAQDEMHALYGNLACFDAIAMGCCVAVFSRTIQVGNVIRNGTQIASVAVGSWIYLKVSIGMVPTWGPTLMALTAAAFLFVEGGYSAQAELSRPWPFGRPLAWMGRHSYELYLFHILVLAVMRTLVPRSDLSASATPLALLAYLVLSCSLAAAIHRFYAEPLNRWLRVGLQPASHYAPT